MRLSHDVRQNIAYKKNVVSFTRNVVAKCLIYVAIGSQFRLIYLANMPYSEMIATKLRGVGDKFATGSRHPR